MELHITLSTKWVYKYTVWAIAIWPNKKERIFRPGHQSRKEEGGLMSMSQWLVFQSPTKEGPRGEEREREVMIIWGHRSSEGEFHHIIVLCAFPTLTVPEGSPGRYRTGAALVLNYGTTWGVIGKSQGGKSSGRRCIDGTPKGCSLCVDVNQK